MVLGDRLRQLRESKNLSQGDIEHRTGLLRCYLSRCENQHTVPSISTLEKWAKALEVPMWRLFYEREGTPPDLAKAEAFLKKEIAAPQLSSADVKVLRSMRRLMPRISERDRSILLKMTGLMARRS